MFRGDRHRWVRREDAAAFAAAMARLRQTWNRTLQLTSDILRLAEANQRLIESIMPDAPKRFKLRPLHIPRFARLRATKLN
jgi:hypothetical protein